MTKLTLDAHGQTIRVKDGRKVLAKIVTTLTTNKIEGLIAGMQPDPEADEPTTLEALVESLTAAAREAEARKASVVPEGYREKYGAEQNCGDDVAVKLTKKVTDPKTGVDLEACREVAASNGIEDRFDGWMGKGLNAGMVRMNLGNVLRGMVRRGEEVHGL